MEEILNSDKEILNSAFQVHFNCNFLPSKGENIHSSLTPDNDRKNEIRTHVLFSKDMITHL